jgi:hydroxyethylthiazole kinase
MSIETIITQLHAMREAKPLVVNITNYVVMNNTANALLAIGASPIMAHSMQELDEMMSFSGALVINIGTLDSVWLPRMRYAIEQANKHGKPVVLDPVGCGASRLRTDASRDLAGLAKKLIVRGNASEIIAMAGEISQGKGVDAQDSSDAAIDAAKALVNSYHCNVVISGETDHIIGENHHYRLKNGSAMMPLVTGTGCSLSALTGAFAAVGDETGLTAAAVMSIAGEVAAERSPGPGSLQLHLLDSLYQLNEETVRQRIQLF